MALTFPLSLADFADKLKMASAQWHLQRRDEVSGLGSGQILTANLSPPLWRADVSIIPSYHADADQILALIESLDGSINDFYLYPPQRKYPQSDPDGSVLGSSTPTINSIGGDQKSMSVAGLPSEYTLTRGDFLSFNYGTNPTRRALHRMVETRTANGSGVTAAFEVRPHIRPGATVGANVTLVKPSMRAFVVPGSLNSGSIEAIMTFGISFQAMQRIA